MEWEVIDDDVEIVMFHQSVEDLEVEKKLAQQKFAEKEKLDEDAQWEVVESKRNKKMKKKKKMESTLAPLQTIEPEGVNVIGETGEWELIEWAVDSGATETVINEETIASVEVKESPASRRGVKYEVANGVRIPNLGEKKFQAVSDEGVARTLTAQVCDVNKSLLSVKKVVKAGNRVVFDDEGSYIEDKGTGERMWLKEEGGMYLLSMWVRKPF
jgi:hypothetical protein